MNTPPGMEIFSSLWFDTFLTNCPEPLRPVVERICTGFQLGNTSDPNIVASMVLKGFGEAFDYEYVVEKDGTKYDVNEIALSRTGEFTFFGESDKDACVFSSGDILQRFEKEKNNNSGS